MGPASGATPDRRQAHQDCGSDGPRHGLNSEELNPQNGIAFDLMARYCSDRSVKQINYFTAQNLWLKIVSTPALKEPNTARKISPNSLSTPRNQGRRGHNLPITC